jgi:hypothetical protein
VEYVNCSGSMTANDTREIKSRIAIAKSSIQQAEDSFQ